MTETGPINKNDPPDEYWLPDPPGPILYAAVNDDGRHAGYVWASANPLARPGAGLVLTSPPSEAMQDALAETSLRYGWERDQDSPAAGEWLAFLADTYTGANGIQVDAEVSTTSKLATVYEAAGMVTP